MTSVEKRPNPCLVAEPDKVLVGEVNEWVANPLGPGQTSPLQIKICCYLTTNDLIYD